MTWHRSREGERVTWRRSREGERVTWYRSREGERELLLYQRMRGGNIMEGPHD